MTPYIGPVCCSDRYAGSAVVNLGNFVSTDDGRFSIRVLAGADFDQTDSVAVTVNWFEDLRWLVPTGQ